MKILISGYFGFDNIGDEAILAAMVAGFKKFNPALEIVVLSAKPKESSHNHLIKAINRNNFWQIISELMSSKILVSGGGSLLQDKTSNRSFYYYLALICLAKLLQKKVYIFAQTLGPVKGKFNRILLRQILKRVNLITVRDSDSFKLWSQSINGNKLVKTADPTFLLEPQNNGLELLKTEGIKEDGAKLIGISLRPSQANLETIAQLADKLVEQLKAKIVFLPLHYDNDLKVIKQVQAKMKQQSNTLSRPYSYSQMISLMKELDLVIGMRLHALIFATLALRPSIGLSYDPKVANFMADIEQPCFELSNLSWESIMSKVKEIFAKKEIILNELQTIRVNLRKEAKENFLLIERLK